MSKTPLLPPRTLGEFLRTVRRTWGWSQKEMAHALQCDQASISFWERDQVRPSGPSRLALACLFGLSLERLLDEDNHFIPAVPSRSMPCFSHLPEALPPSVQQAV